jgi:hypothetical protein
MVELASTRHKRKNLLRMHEAAREGQDVRKFPNRLSGAVVGIRPASNADAQPEQESNSMQLARHARIGMFAALLAVACDDTSTEPTVESVAGTYVATTFTTTTNGVTTNQLTNGATITLTLISSGATAGRIVIPDQEEAVDDPLTGTWEIDGNSIDMNHTADTLLESMTFRVEGNRLVGDDTFDGTRVQIVLTRQ